MSHKKSITRRQSNTQTEKRMCAACDGVSVVVIPILMSAISLCVSALCESEWLLQLFHYFIFDLRWYDCCVNVVCPLLLRCYAVTCCCCHALMSYYSSPGGRKRKLLDVRKTVICHWCYHTPYCPVSCLPAHCTWSPCAPICVCIHGYNSYLLHRAV